MTKDEAIHKALKVLNCLNNDRVYETAWVKGAINACEEALEQQEIGDAEIRQMLDDIEYYQKRVEALEQSFTRDWKETIDERIARDSEFKEALEQPAQEPIGYVSELPIVTPQAIRSDKNDVFNIPVYAG